MSPAHERTAHGIRILKHKDPIVRLLNKAGLKPRLHGFRVWQSTFMAMEFLESHPLEQDQRIMEIGCGWGLLGIFCARRFSAQVLLTDADEQVFPYAIAHARLNRVSVRTELVRFENISDHSLREHDVLVGADICFWPELGTQLRRLIERALALGVKKVVLADPGRETFRQLAKHCHRHYMATTVPWDTTSKSGGSMLIVEGST
jgi:predicted nicotinamide N-methyase